MKDKIRILVSDDHELFRSGLIGMLKEEKNFFVVGEAENGREMVKKYFSLSPDIVIADISMPQLSGTDAAKEILKEDKNAKILFLTMLEDEQYIYYTYKIGGWGMMSKNIAKGELIYAINSICEGNKYFGPNFSDKKLKELTNKYDMLQKYSENITEELTDREEEILKYISEGLMSTEIAEKMFVSKKTIDAHRQHIMQKFNLKTLPALIKFAIEYTNAQKISTNTIAN